MQSAIWLALMIGNSRLHWGLFNGEQFINAWSSDYLPRDRIQSLIHQPTLENFLHLTNYPSSSFPFPLTNFPPTPLVLASVVPTQTRLWESYPQLQIIFLEDIPINNMYPSLGSDRALALVAAGESFGFPVLVIDAGTALTFTTANETGSFIGGAILPGLGLQLKTLASQTGQLPPIELSTTMTSRWAMNTNDAIQSGIVYTLLAGIEDFVSNWWQSFPNGKVVMTGGDGMFLHTNMEIIYPDINPRISLVSTLVLQGISLVRKYKFSQSE